MVAISGSICLYCVGIVLQCSIAYPLLLLDYKLLGVWMWFCVWTCCKATCTLSSSNYRGRVILKLTFVGTMKIYICEIVSFAINLLLGEDYYLRHQVRHILQQQQLLGVIKYGYVICTYHTESISNPIRSWCMVIDLVGCPKEWLAQVSPRS